MGTIKPDSGFKEIGEKMAAFIANLEGISGA